MRTVFKARSSARARSGCSPESEARVGLAITAAAAKKMSVRRITGRSLALVPQPADGFHEPFAGLPVQALLWPDASPRPRDRGPAAAVAADLGHHLRIPPPGHGAA